MKGDNAGRKKRITGVAKVRIKAVIDEVAKTPNFNFIWENVRAAINEKVFPDKPIALVTLKGHAEIKAYFEDRKERKKNTANAGLTYSGSTKAEVVETVVELKERIKQLERELRAERRKHYDEMRAFLSRPNDPRFAQAIRRVIDEASS